MTPPPGTVAQLAYIVRPGTLAQAVDYWVKIMGAGPFFTGEFPLTDQTYHGQPAEQRAVVACGYLGDMQIEIIDPISTTPNVYTDFLRRNPEPPVGGLYHHIMIDEGDCDATVKKLVDGGCRIAFTATPPTGGKLYYLEAFETTGGYLEVIESPTWPTVVESMKAARKAWDGRDPVRSFETLA